MNYSGILVVARQGSHDQVVNALNALSGVEVHQVDEPSGRIIAVQEAENIHAEIDGIKRIKALPHVIMAEMVFHYLAEDQRVYESMPDELKDDQADGSACAVPAYLNG